MKPEASGGDGSVGEGILIGHRHSAPPWIQDERGSRGDSNRVRKRGDEDVADGSITLLELREMGMIMIHGCLAEDASM